MVPHDPSSQESSSALYSLCPLSPAEEATAASVLVQGPPRDRTPTPPHHRPPPGPAEGYGDSVWVLKAALSPEAVRARKEKLPGPWGRLRSNEALIAPYPTSPQPRLLLSAQVPGTPPSALLCHSSLTSGGPEFPAGPQVSKPSRYQGFRLLFRK